MPNSEPVTYSVTLGTRAEQNPYMAELAAIATALRGLPPHIRRRQITIFTSNQAALRAVNQPGHQSGQASIRQIYEAVRKLGEGGNQVTSARVPARGEFDLGQRAKAAARQATNQGCSPRE